MSTGETIYNSVHTEAMDSDADYKSLLSKLENDYKIKIIDFIGKGSYSQVMKGKSDNKLSIAVKIVDNRVQSEYVRRFLPREMTLVKTLNHECVIRVYEYLQRCEIVHRDLKCENVFLDLYENVKLGDFGFARHLKPNEKSTTFCGSRAYVAPEILRAIPYTGNTVDIWSSGVVLYVMVTGLMPYDERNPQKMVERQLAHRIRFPKITLSVMVKTLIYEILHPYPLSRPTYKAICDSDWLKDTPYILKGVGKDTF